MGAECLAEIKTNENLKGLPVYIFTMALPHDPEFETNMKNTFSAIGSNGFITKTSNLTQLKQAVQNALLKVSFPLTGNI